MSYQIKRASASKNSSDSLQINTSMLSFLQAEHAASEACLSAVGPMKTPPF